MLVEVPAEGVTGETRAQVTGRRPGPTLRERGKGISVIIKDYKVVATAYYEVSYNFIA